jgi:hypothetical protein
MRKGDFATKNKKFSFVELKIVLGGLPQSPQQKKSDKNLPQ